MKEQIGDHRILLEEAYTYQEEASPAMKEMAEAYLAAQDKEAFFKQFSSYEAFYHFSPIRENTVNWHDFRLQEEVLEIGSQYGALSGYLYEHAASLTCLELSKTKAKYLARRYPDNDMQILVGSLYHDALKNRTFDTIVLIETLETGKAYGKQKDYATEILCRCKELLKQEGTLLIGVDNRFSLRNFSGMNHAAEEDRYLVLEGSDPIRRSFSKMEMKQKLEAAGFHDVTFYYPIPDYKFVSEIYSADREPVFGDIFGSYPRYFEADQQTFHEDMVLNGIIKDGMFSYFANSFLIEVKHHE